MGGTDLYRVQKVANSWGKPENLGAEINTPGDEKFPFISKDGTLYFSSNGHYGLGGLDIYQVVIDKKTNALGKVANLGAPFNSSKDDFGFIVAKDNQSGFLTSNRPGGIGSDDIYSWRNKEIKFKIKVVDKVTKEIVANANCKLLCSEDFRGNKRRMQKVEWNML
ncbi:MAG: PD40 domain-containing protein [Bacteroidetes bacterium]|nr:PD40 domain-containing protein [Bacteroidota bacterium]